MHAKRGQFGVNAETGERDENSLISTTLGKVIVEHKARRLNMCGFLVS